MMHVSTVRSLWPQFIFQCFIPATLIVNVHPTVSSSLQTSFTPFTHTLDTTLETATQELQLSSTLTHVQLQGSLRPVSQIQSMSSNGTLSSQLSTHSTHVETISGNGSGVLGETNSSNGEQTQQLMSNSAGVIETIKNSYPVQSNFDYMDASSQISLPTPTVLTSRGPSQSPKSETPGTPSPSLPFLSETNTNNTVFSSISKYTSDDQPHSSVESSTGVSLLSTSLPTTMHRETLSTASIDPMRGSSDSLVETSVGINTKFDTRIANSEVMLPSSIWTAASIQMTSSTPSNNAEYTPMISNLDTEKYSSESVFRISGSNRLYDTNAMLTTSVNGNIGIISTFQAPSKSDQISPFHSAHLVSDSVLSDDTFTSKVTTWSQVHAYFNSPVIQSVLETEDQSLSSSFTQENDSPSLQTTFMGDETSLLTMQAPSSSSDNDYHHYFSNSDTVSDLETGHSTVGQQSLVTQTLKPTSAFPGGTSSKSSSHNIFSESDITELIFPSSTGISKHNSENIPSSQLESLNVVDTFHSMASNLPYPQEESKFLPLSITPTSVRSLSPTANSLEQGLSLPFGASSTPVPPVSTAAIDQIPNHSLPSSDELNPTSSVLNAVSLSNSYVNLATSHSMSELDYFSKTEVMPSGSEVLSQVPTSTTSIKDEDFPTTTAAIVSSVSPGNTTGSVIPSVTTQSPVSPQEGDILLQFYMQGNCERIKNREENVDLLLNAMQPVFKLLVNRSLTTKYCSFADLKCNPFILSVRLDKKVELVKAKIATYNSHKDKWNVTLTSADDGQNLTVKIIHIQSLFKISRDQSTLSVADTTVIALAAIITSILVIAGLLVFVYEMCYKRQFIVLRFKTARDMFKARQSFALTGLPRQSVISEMKDNGSLGGNHSPPDGVYSSLEIEDEKTTSFMTSHDLKRSSGRSGKIRRSLRKIAKSIQNGNAGLKKDLAPAGEGFGGSGKSRRPYGLVVGLMGYKPHYDVDQQYAVPRKRPKKGRVYGLAIRNTSGIILRKTDPTPTATLANSSHSQTTAGAVRTSRRYRKHSMQKTDRTDSSENLVRKKAETSKNDDGLVNPSFISDNQSAVYDSKSSLHI